MKIRLEILALAAVCALGGAACKRKTPRYAPVDVSVSGAAAPAASAAAPKFAVLETSLGVVKVRLFTDRAPNTAAHFIALATGAKRWRDPRDGREKAQPLYDGVVFHRVIPGFMVQTGDPLGDGRGGIGAVIPDEFHSQLRFDRPGLLGMANAGPNTNGSQFFITVAPTPHLNDLHSLFGEVVSGFEVVKAISEAPRDMADGSDRPFDPPVLKRVRIVDSL